MTKSSKLNRREFSKVTAAAAVLAGPAINVLGANEKIQLGCIGLGGRGGFHFKEFNQYDDVKITALCDVYKPHYERFAETVKNPVLKTQDFRKVLESKDVDAVVIAPPDHWHTIMALQACLADKDIYVEKPMSRTIEEGLCLVDAASKYKRVVQVGQQQRSSAHFQKAVEMVKSGEIGKVTSVRCINPWPIDGYLSPKAKHGIGIVPDSPAPEGLDYDMWLGPAPLRPFNQNRFLVNFYFFLDYSGGMLTAWGVHLFDIVMWAMGPTMHGAYCYGGKFVHDDERDNPDTCEATFETPGYTFHYSLRHGNSYPDDPEEGQIDHGIYFYGDKATLLANRTHLKVFPEHDFKNAKIIPAKGGDFEHKRNFIDCIRSRKETCCPPIEGFNANLPGMLALISWQLGRSIKWDPDKKTITGDAEAIKMMKREYRKPWELPKF